MPKSRNTVVGSGAADLVSAVNDVKNLKPAEIAAHLKKSKILGRPGTVGRCPLALLMHNKRGGHFYVGQTYIIRQTRGDQVDKIRTPPNLAAFVRMFDKGEFPELIQVPPRCTAQANTRKVYPPGPGATGGRQIHAKKQGAARLQLSKEVGRFVVGGRRNVAAK